LFLAQGYGATSIEAVAQLTLYHRRPPTPGGIAANTKKRIGSSLSQGEGSYDASGWQTLRDVSSVGH
jgi:hypothetical protein